MSLPHRVVRCTFSGTMFGGAEIWTTGLYFGWDNKDADPITTEGMSNVSAAWEVFFKAAGSQVSSQYTYDMLKMAVINNDGHTLADSAQYFAPTTTIVGGGSPAALPPQVSLVASLRAAEPRGLATKGRMFLPGISAGVQPSGKLEAFTRDQIATNLKTFFDSIYNDADLPGNPVLISVGRGLLHTDGNIRRVTQLKLGDVYDTQRRRRNALQESYKTLAVAGG